MKNMFSCIEGIVCTEKTARAVGKVNCVTLRSPSWASKCDIKSFLLNVFPDVTIVSVRSMNVNGKVKRFRGRIGCRKNVKKFIVSFVGNIEMFNQAISNSEGV